MKYYLLLPIVLFFINNACAQIVHGEAIVFTYNSLGQRIKREYSPNTVISQKPGKENEPQADTIVGSFKYDGFDLGLDTEKVFVRAYPNPVRDVLFIENVDWEDGNSAEIHLFDISGKLILKRKTNLKKDQLSLGTVAPGTYKVSYYLNDNYLVSWKIIKL